MQNIVKTQDIYEEEQTEKVTEKTDKEETAETILAQMLGVEEQTWEVEIPSIGLIAPIAQGTTQEVMLEYVGHFENTSFWKGNIGLAAHNRRISNKLF